VKVTLLLMCRADNAFASVYLSVARPITRLTIVGLVMLTLSGIGWILQGYTFTPSFVVKLVLVGVIWVLGPVIDNVAEPRFKALAPAAGEPATAAFIQSYRRYLSLEVMATGLFYVITVMGVLL
jgi:hypothetical protein